MHAFVNTQKSIVFKTKSFVIGNCSCQRWNLHTLNRRFGVPRQVMPSSYCVVSTSVESSRTGYGQVQNAVKFNVFATGQCYRLPIKISDYCLVVVRHFSVDRRLFDKEPLKPSSKVEETVQALKEDLKEKSTVAVATAEKPPLWTRMKRKVVEEVTHYYHGFRLLFIDLNVSRKLIWRVLNGKSLTRREHKLLVRTVSDLFRLVPFSVFIIVPFMEFLLPFAIRLFPGMLPSTFQTATEKEEKMKQSLKVKLEMAKFLQKTLDDMSVQGKGHYSESAKEFTEFFHKVRTSGEQASTEEIMKFSKLFEDEITLDSLSRPQLTALCRVLEIQPIGTNNLLRFQLRMKLRSLAADDKVIQKEGIESLSTAELQQACRARGMRAYGMSKGALRQQLGQWLELSLEKKVPPSLLLLSRALLLPDTIPTSDKLKATISVLPDAVVTQTKAAIGEREGRIDNKTKIEIIKEEVRKIDEEHREMKEEKRDKEILIDTAQVISEGVEASSSAQEGQPEGEPKELLTTTDLETLEDALDTLSKDKKVIVEKKELDELKEEMADYQEDVHDLKTVQQVMKDVDPKVPEVKESKAAKRLFKKVNSMISKLDAVLVELEQEEKKIKKDLEDALQEKETQEKSEELVSIEELKKAIKQIQKVPDDSLVDRISEILSKMDIDKDGAIRLDDVLRNTRELLQQWTVCAVRVATKEELMFEVNDFECQKSELRACVLGNLCERYSSTSKVTALQIPLSQFVLELINDGYIRRDFFVDCI